MPCPNGGKLTIEAANVTFGDDDPAEFMRLSPG